MGWILVVGIERVLRGNICKSDFFLNLFWIPSDFFWLNSIVGNFHGLLVESQRWELREFWEVTFEGLGICLSPAPLPTLSRPLFIFSKLFHRRHSDQAPAASRAPFLFIVCISPPCQTFANLPKLCFLLLSTISPDYSAQIKEKYSATSPKAQFSIRSQNNQLSNKEKYCRH